MSIGTLGEKSLHAALKRWYALPDDQPEVLIDGYHIDLVRPPSNEAQSPLLIEFQTRNFAALKTKLPRLLNAAHTVHLVHPIPLERWLVLLDLHRERQLQRRKSPKRGALADIFRELVSIPTLICHERFSLEVLLVRDEEIRREDGRGSWRRKRQSIDDRRLLEVVSATRFDTPADFAVFLPATLPDLFTVSDLAKQGRYPAPIAGKMAYCLRAMGVIEWVEKRRNAYVYRRTLPAIEVS